MQVSHTLRVLCCSKHHAFYLGGRWNPGVWLRVPQPGGIGGQVSGDRSLKTKVGLGLGPRGMVGPI